MTISRRDFLLAAGAAAALAACSKAKSAARASSAVASSTSTSSTIPASTASPTTSTPSGPARFLKSGPKDGSRVALTFHGSGDLALTRDLLAAASRLNAPITVFAVGQWLDQNPTMASAIQSGGNELANHTYTHPALASVSRTGISKEITECRDVLARQTGTGGRWFRPSGVDVPTQTMLDEAGAAGYQVVVGYDVDPLDYQDPGAAAVVSRVKAGLHPGAIVSLHTGHQGTVDAFEGMVAAIRAAKLEPVLVRDLLA